MTYLKPPWLTLIPGQPNMHSIMTVQILYSFQGPLGHRRKIEVTHYV